MTKEEKDKKLMWLLNGGAYNDNEIAEMAESWAHDNSNGLEDETAKHLGFVAGFKEAYGLGVQDAADIFDEESDCTYNHTPNNPQITIGTKIRSKTNPDVILSIISDDCHEDEFECSNGSVLSLEQIEKYYEVII